MAAIPDPAVLAVMLAAMLSAFAAALRERDFVRAVIAFAAGSAVLAGVFALLGVAFVAVLELAVGAGLTAVLFLVAITLTQGVEADG